MIGMLKMVIKINEKNRRMDNKIIITNPTINEIIKLFKKYDGKKYLVNEEKGKYLKLTDNKVEKMRKEYLIPNKGWRKMKQLYQF